MDPAAEGLEETVLHGDPVSAAIHARWRDTGRRRAVANIRMRSDLERTN